jgi:formamidopyrimidine-DNA glycosylase
MPELPEVETTRRALVEPLTNKRLLDVTVRCPQLRYPIPRTELKTMRGQTVVAVKRRAKYLLLQLGNDTIMIHLGMSGSLRLLPAEAAGPAKKHDHVDFIFSGNVLLRFNDPRRFGSIKIIKANELARFSQSFGPEPLSKDFDGQYLFNKLSSRKSAIKKMLMDNKIVVGVGNIYATESLFDAGIHPLTPANFLSMTQCDALVAAIKKILKKAIRAGGTTLKDFYSATGKPGYFDQKLLVYGREGQSCVNCHTTLCKILVANRSTVYCTRCQKQAATAPTI